MTQFTLVHLGARRIDNTKASQSFSRSARALRELNPRFFSELGLGPPGLSIDPGALIAITPFWGPNRVFACDCVSNFGTQNAQNVSKYTFQSIAQLIVLEIGRLI